MGLKNHSAYTVFKVAHYRTYIRKVVKFDIVQKIIDEATQWVGTEQASQHLDAYLQKIRVVERDSQFIPDTYESFKRNAYLDTDLNDYTRRLVQH